MTGTLQFKRLVTISSIEVEMPPGVFMTTSRAEALSDSARLTAFWMYADMTLLMSPFRSACSTRGVAAMAAAGARMTAAAKSSHANRSATRARMLRVCQGARPTADVKRGTSAARGRRRPRVESVEMSAEPVSPDGDEAAMRELRHRARTTQPLADGEEASLLERSARGDGDSQSRLVAANLGLVIQLADARADRGLLVSDLVQEGSLGLVEAVRSFHESGQADFSAFAQQKVGEQMDAALAAEAAAVRDAEQLVAAASDYERTEILLRRTLHRVPTEAEIAEKLEWSVDRTRYVATVVGEAR